MNYLKGTSLEFYQKNGYLKECNKECFYHCTCNNEYVADCIDFNKIEQEKVFDEEKKLQTNQNYNSITCIYYTFKEVYELIGIDRDFLKEILIEHKIAVQVKGVWKPTPKYEDKFYWVERLNKYGGKFKIYYFTREVINEIEKYL